MKYLVERGADFELANQHGHTPLMIAAFRKHHFVVKYLLSQGADPLKASERGDWSGAILFSLFLYFSSIFFPFLFQFMKGDGFKW